MKNFETLSEAITDLSTRGYSNDFNLHLEWIELDAYAYPDSKSPEMFRRLTIDSKTGN